VLGAIGRFLQKTWAFLQPAVSFVWKILVSILILPFYKLFIVLRLRFSKLLLTARGFFFLLLTNRYILHTVLLAISIPVIATQFEAKSATAMDVGQHSILYAMVTDDREAIVEETARPETIAKNTHYLGAETIQPLPGIDYDYDILDEPGSDMSIPGTIAVKPGELLPGASPETEVAVTPEDHTDMTHETVATRHSTEIYTIKSGDTLASIARRFGVNVGTVMWANDLSSRSILRLGQTLKIPAVSGVLHTVRSGDTLGALARKYGVSAQEIASANQISSATSLSLGRELIIPGGVPPEETPIALAKPTTKNTATSPAVRPGVPISLIKNKAVDVYQELTKADERAKPADVIETKKVTKLLWPTRLHVITQYWGWKHTGLDVDGDYTDPLYASEDGIVEKSGWNNGGYGLQVLIDHQNGMKTRYAHASKLFVKEGEFVKRGQVIAMLGTTGRSTGTHLHYEVYVNGVRKNPLVYLK